MKEFDSSTSYCGLYCGDCIPSSKRLFSLAKDLEDKLADLRFEEYAAMKAMGDAAFNDYGEFLKVLRAIQALECQAPCRAGGGKTACTVRDCVLGRSLRGCWECQEWRTCGLLDRLKRFHPNLDHHLELIRQEGMNAWSTKRKGHYSWQRESRE